MNDAGVLMDGSCAEISRRQFLRIGINQFYATTEEPRNSAFQGTSLFYALLREMPYYQYIESKEKASRDLEFMLL